MATYTSAVIVPGLHTTAATEMDAIGVSAWERTSRNRLSRKISAPLLTAVLSWRHEITLSPCQSRYIIIILFQLYMEYYLRRIQTPPSPTIVSGSLSDSFLPSPTRADSACRLKSTLSWPCLLSVSLAIL